jgi:hypothetical protein
MPYRISSWVASPRKDNFRLTCGITSEPASDSVVGAGTGRDSQAQAGVRCHACGMEVGAAKKFCRFCGAPVQPSAAPISQRATGTCPKCGTIVSAGKKFCKACGYRLGPVRTAQETPAKAVTAAGAAAVVAAPEPQPVQAPLEPRQEERAYSGASLAHAERAVASELRVLATPKPATTEGQPVAHRLTEPTPADETTEQSPSSAIPIAQEFPLIVAAKFPRNLLYWIGGVLILAGLANLVVWYVWFSPEARLFKAVIRGDLVTPEGSSAYDYYNRLKARGVGNGTRSKLRRDVFPKLISTGDATLQKRSEGTSMKRAEFRELANLYEFAAELAPDDPKALSRHYYSLGTLALLDGRLQDALQSIRRSVDYDPNWAPAFNDLGKVYVRSNDYYHAEWSYKKALEIQPSWAFPQLNLGGVYLHRKEWGPAESAYLKAGALDQTLATPWYFLGQVYEADARTADAISAYQKAVELAASRPSSAFHVDVLQARISRLQGKLTMGRR